jgi:hypothetical protein
MMEAWEMTFFGTLDQAKPLMEGEPLEGPLDLNVQSLLGAKLIQATNGQDLTLSTIDNNKSIILKLHATDATHYGKLKLETTPGSNAPCVIESTSSKLNFQVGGFGGSINLIANAVQLFSIAGDSGVFTLQGAGGYNATIKAYTGQELHLITQSDNKNIKLLPHGTGQVVSGKINSSSDALPVASATYRGQTRTVEGAAGARDRNYLCMKSDAGAYSWVEVANGGA